jgi:hypothetical protein
VNWGALAKLILCLAPLPLLAQVAVFVSFRDRPEYPPVAIGVTLVTGPVMVSLIFIGKRASLRAIAPDKRRQSMSTLLGNWIGLLLVPLTILSMMHAATPKEWFVIYPLWLIVFGCTALSLAPNAGIFYLNGGLCFLLAVLAPFVPFYMPLVVGALMSLNFTTIGLVLRRVAREAASHGAAPEATALP